MPQEIIGPLLSIGAALELPVIGYVLLALVLAGVVSFATTPLVKALSVKVGAIDVPRDGRRMHDHPIPRMGGLAIFLGFIISVLLLMPLDQPKQGMLLGAVIIVVLGIFDDIYALSAKLKFVVQIAAACVAVFSGNRIEVLSNPNIFSSNPYWELGVLSVPVTIIWIVALTNAVNLIDGLDGLAWRRSWSCRSAWATCWASCWFFSSNWAIMASLAWVSPLRSSRSRSSSERFCSRAARSPSSPASLALTWAIWLLIVSSVPWSVVCP